jgi:hypothetical protein
MYDNNLAGGMKNLGQYISAARPYVANIMSRGGSLAGRAAMVGGPLGAAANVASSAYPYVQDSNFPGVGASRGAFGNPIARAAQNFAPDSLSPSDRVAQGFDAAPQQGSADPALVQRFLDAIQRRQGAPALPAPIEVGGQAQPVAGRGGVPMPRSAPAEMEQTPSAAPEDPNWLQRFFSSVYDNHARDQGPAPSGPRFGPFPS